MVILLTLLLQQQLPNWCSLSSNREKYEAAIEEQILPSCTTDTTARKHSPERTPPTKPNWDSKQRNSDLNSFSGAGPQQQQQRGSAPHKHHFQGQFPMTSCFISHRFLSNFIDYHLKLIYSFPSQHYFALHLKGRWGGGFFSVFHTTTPSQEDGLSWVPIDWNDCSVKQCIVKAKPNQEAPSNHFPPSLSSPPLEILYFRDSDLGFYTWSFVVKQYFKAENQTCAEVWFEVPPAGR